MLLIISYTYAIKSEKKKGISIRVPAIAVIDNAIPIRKLNCGLLTPSRQQPMKRKAEEPESPSNRKRSNYQDEN